MRTGWRALLLAAALCACGTPPDAVRVVPGVDRIRPPTTADASVPTDRPLLRLETGTHLDAVQNVAADGRGDIVASVANDKVLRLWSARTQRALHVVRPPMGDGAVGMLTRVAVSRDGRTVAAAWRDSVSASILMFDVASGRLTRRIDGLIDAASGLAFSPDGRLLVASIVSGAVQVFDVSAGAETARDRVYGAECHSVDLSADGTRVLTSSVDGYLRLYGLDAQGRLSRLRAANAQQGLSRPINARLSPDGRWIAVGFDHLGGLAIHRASDLAHVAQMPVSGANSNIAAFAWSADARFLYASASWPGHEWRLRRWEALTTAGGELSFGESSPFSDLPAGAVGGALTMASFAPPAGGVVVGTTGSAVALVGADGRWVVLGEQHAARLTRWVTTPFKPPLLRVSQDGAAVEFEGGLPGTRASFDVRRRGAVDAGTPLEAPLAAVPGIEIALARRQGVAAPGEWPMEVQMNGRSLGLPAEEIPTAYAFVPGDSRFALATNFRVRMFHGSGRMLWSRWMSWALAVNVSRNGRWVVVECRDGVLHWLRAADGTERLALYPDPDGRRWIVWTAAGFYDASLGAEDLAGWQVPQGRDGLADFFPLSRFRRDYFRPDVIDHALATDDDEAALRLAAADTGREAQAKPLAEGLPPVVTPQAPEAESAGAAKTTLRFKVRELSSVPLQRVFARVDGLAAEAAVRYLGRDADGETWGEISLFVPLGGGEVQVFAENANGVSTPAVWRLGRRGAGLPAQVPKVQAKPRLFALVVGVSRYERPSFRLELAATDADDFTQSLLAQKGRGLYQDVQVRRLTDAQARRADVQAGLDWLRAQVGPQDVGLLFLAGHGVNDAGGRYFFVPVDGDFDRLDTTAVEDARIREALSQMKGHAVFFIDTCRSGGALGAHRRSGDTQLFARELASAENNVAVMASAARNQDALEHRSWGHGAFTKALLEGIGGRADFKSDGRVTLNGLHYYVSDRVKALTEERQTPVLISPSGYADFPLAALR